MRQPRIGLALAGGGPLGAIYEVGALCALEEAVDGLDFTACDGYIGVSMHAVLNNETEAQADEPEAVLDTVDQHMAPNPR